MIQTAFSEDQKVPATFVCPVCSRSELQESGDICPECGWEMDRIQYADHEDTDGANILSVNESVLEYLLLRNSKTGDDAKKAKQEFENAAAAVYAVDGAEQPADEETVSSEIKSARQIYMDHLNNLLRRCFDSAEILQSVSHEEQ